MQVSDWSLLLLLLKLISYLSIAALAGTLMMRFLNNSNHYAEQNFASFYQYLKRWQMICVAVGCAASLLQIPIEAGAMAESGFDGMIDPFMLEIVWLSVIGDQAALRIPAFILALITVSAWQTQSNKLKTFNATFTLLILTVIIYSFTLVGHSADENIFVKSIFIFHLIAIASWVGSLWPLYKSCELLPIGAVKSLMQHFGLLAILIIAALLISGVTLILQYLHSFAELYTSNYGQLILLKLLLVSAMLLLGAWHKLYLVPQITQQHHVGTLKRSISVEMFIALFVLITTSIFTTLVGPPI